MNIAPRILSNLGLLGAGLFAVGNSIFYVSAGENGIVYNYLTKSFSTNYKEGYHVRIPLVTRPVIFETRTRFLEESSTTANKDLQKVNFTIRVLFRPDPKNLVSIFENLGLQYAEKVINPLVKEISKAIIANYDAHQLLSQREKLSQDIKIALKERIQQFNILIEEVTINNTSFSKEYEKAIEEKQIAQQKAERMKYKVQRAAQIKKSTIIQAEADVESIRLIGNAVKQSPAYLTLQKIQASKEIAKILSTSANNVLLDSNLLLMNQIHHKETL